MSDLTSGPSLVEFLLTSSETLNDPNLEVRVHASGLSQPTGMRFLGNDPGDFFARLGPTGSADPKSTETQHSAQGPAQPQFVSPVNLHRKWRELAHKSAECSDRQHPWRSFRHHFEVRVYVGERI